MSITKDFEDNYDGNYYDVSAVEELLSHTRALETILKKQEFDDDGICKECNSPRALYEHSTDCKLAKLLEGVE